MNSETHDEFIALLQAHAAKLITTSEARAALRRVKPEWFSVTGEGAGSAASRSAETQWWGDSTMWCTSIYTKSMGHDGESSDIELMWCGRCGAVVASVKARDHMQSCHSEVTGS